MFREKEGGAVFKGSREGPGKGVACQGMQLNAFGDFPINWSSVGTEVKT
jgi:hypothetical protein